MESGTHLKTVYICSVSSSIRKSAELKTAGKTRAIKTIKNDVYICRKNSDHDS